MKYLIQANPTTTTRPKNPLAESEVLRMFPGNAVKDSDEHVFIYVNPGMEADTLRVIDQIYAAAGTDADVLSNYANVNEILTWPKVKDLLRIAFYSPTANAQFTFLDVQVATGRGDDRSCAPATPGGYWDVFHSPTRKTARITSWLIAHTLERMVSEHPVALETLRHQPASTTTAAMFLSHLALGYYDE